jgi:hypothetical protein
MSGAAVPSSGGSVQTLAGARVSLTSHVTWAIANLTGYPN